MPITGKQLMGFLRWEKRGIANIALAGFPVMFLYATSFALLALGG